MLYVYTYRQYGKQQLVLLFHCFIVDINEGKKSELLRCSMKIKSKSGFVVSLTVSSSYRVERKWKVKKERKGKPIKEKYNHKYLKL